MSLFTGTRSYYRQFRPGIPEDVAAALDQAAPTRTDGPRRLLGVGTGLVAEALDDIIAIDNDADMLARAGTAPRPKLPRGHAVVALRERRRGLRAARRLEGRPGHDLPRVPLARPGRRAGAPGRSRLARRRRRHLRRQQLLDRHQSLEGSRGMPPEVGHGLCGLRQRS